MIGRIIHRVLTRAEWAYCACCAGLRNETALTRGFRSQYGLPGNDPRHHLYHQYGCCSEYACSLPFGWPWNPNWHYAGRVPDFQIGSLAIDVKHTIHDDGRLCVPTEGHADWYYVLVTGEPPIQDIRGWMLGAEPFADPEKYFRKLSKDPARGKQYFVDQCDIHPIDELLELIRAEKAKLAAHIPGSARIMESSSRTSISTIAPPTDTVA